MLYSAVSNLDVIAATNDNARLQLVVLLLKMSQSKNIITKLNEITFVINVYQVFFAPEVKKQINTYCLPRVQLLTRIVAIMA